jgi:protein gp37
VSDRSAIEWTDATWNPVTGCTEVSPGCDNCYARKFAERFRGVAGHPYEQGFDLKLWPSRLPLPLSWRRPRRVFVDSMSDLFHPNVPAEFIQAVFETMVRASHHQFQVLTKRPNRLAHLAPRLPWPDNVWVGVSVEAAAQIWRVQYLRTVPAAVRFISAEPLLGELDELDLSGIDWVIAGGESGPKHRPIDPAWVRGLRDLCASSETAFFFKQWGGHVPKKNGRELDGRTHDEWPTPLIRRRQLPSALAAPRLESRRPSEERLAKIR